MRKWKISKAEKYVEWKCHKTTANLRIHFAQYAAQPDAWHSTIEACIFLIEWLKRHLKWRSIDTCEISVRDHVTGLEDDKEENERREKNLQKISKIEK